jgi:spermidine synthase
MLAGLLWLPPGALGRGRAVQLGLGAGALARFTRQALGMATTVVEINPEVVRANRLWFHLDAGDRRLALVLGDAGDWVRQAEPQQAQLLHVDLYDHEAAAPVLDSADFYADCRALLADDGVMSVNLFGRDASFARSTARIAAAFGAARVWTMQATREGNTIVVATRTAPLPPRAELLARAATIESRFRAQGLPARRWVRMIRPA